MSSRFHCSYSRTPVFATSTVTQRCSEQDTSDECSASYVANPTTNTANFCKWNVGTGKCEKAASCVAELCRHIPLDGTFGVTSCSDIKDDRKQGPNFNLKRACESFFERSEKPTGLQNHNCILYGPTNTCQALNTQACLERNADDPKVFQEIHSCPTFETGNCNECKDPSGGSHPVEGTEIFRHDCGWKEGGGREVFCNCGTQGL